MRPANFPDLTEAGSTNATAHRVFWEQLRDLPSDGQASREIAAALTILRVVDAWLDREEVSAWGVERIAAELLNLGEDTATRRPLRHVLQCVRSHPVRRSRVALALARYARQLEHIGSWHLAADAYDTVIRRISREGSSLAIQCHVRLGFVYRHLNCLDLAERSFRHARRLAIRTGSLVWELRAELGRATIITRRGNIPAAERLLQRSLARAKADGMSNVRGRLLHALATIACDRKDYQGAITLLFQALRLIRQRVSRDRILSDLAYAFMRMGFFDPARSAYVLLAKRAHERWVRQAACINLLVIAFSTADRPMFDEYAKMLEGEKLTAEHRASYRVTLGDGLLQFGDIERAHAELRRALAIAVEFGFGEIVIEAEQLLKLTSGRPASPGRIALPAELRDAADTLRRLHASEARVSR